MKDTLVDIRSKLQEGAYQNEEHVRLCLVARILDRLGWDVWNPRQVNAEFKPVPKEDRSKVDFALFSGRQNPSVFVEVKPVGKVTDLAETERQLRDYNRDMAATFCIITTGQTWRFYYTLMPGEFAKKCFASVDLLQDNLADVESAFSAFLNKSEIESGKAEEEARKLVRLNQKERTMNECLPKAIRLTSQAPFPRLPEALVKLCEGEGVTVTVEEASAFLENTERPKHDGGDDKHDDVPPGVTPYDPDAPPDLMFTKVIEATFGDKGCANWNDLLRAGVVLAHGAGHTAQEMSSYCGARIREGHHAREGYAPVSGTSVSLQGLDAQEAYACALRFAKKLRVRLYVRFRWREKDRAASPGQEGSLEWRP